MPTCCARQPANSCGAPFSAASTSSSCSLVTFMSLQYFSHSSLVPPCLAFSFALMSCLQADVCVGDFCGGGLNGPTRLAKAGYSTQQ